MKADLVRVHHMLDATSEVLEFSADKTRLDLDNDRMLCLSLVHLLERRPLQYLQSCERNILKSLGVGLLGCVTGLSTATMT